MKKFAFYFMKWGSLVLGIYAFLVALNIVFLDPFPWDWMKFGLLAVSIAVCWAGFWNIMRLL